MTQVPPWIGAASLAARPIGGGGGGPPPVVFLPESRPATPLALTAPMTTSGDSWEFGVSVPAGQSWPAQLGAMITPAVLRRGVSGQALRPVTTAQNPQPIPFQISGQGAGPLAANSQANNGGINDSNIVVVPLPDAQFWVANSIAGVNVGWASLTGGAGQSRIYQARTAPERNNAGMSKWSGWVQMSRTLKATHGARILDLHRLLQFRSPAPVGSLDYENVNNFWGLPLNYRGGLSTFPYTTQFGWNTCDATTGNNVAGVTAAAPPAGFSDAALIQNVNANGVLGANIFRNVTSTSWVLVDENHPSQWSSAIIAQSQFDVCAAIQGSGAPMAVPAEINCQQDIVAGGVVGTIYYNGPSPATIGLFDATNTLVPTLTLTDNGSINNRGSITVSRSATGALVEGFAQLTLQLTDAAAHVLHSPVDFYIGQPSTQTVPRMWNIGGAIGNPNSDFSFAGEDVTGLLDGDKFAFGGWLKPSTLVTTQYVFGFSSGFGSNSQVLIRINTAGALAIQINGAGGVLLVNTSIASMFAAGVATWFAFDVDVSVAQPTVRGYYNKAGAGADVAINALGVAATGPTTIAASFITSRFLALRDASIANVAFPVQDPTRSQYYGAFGNLLVWNGNIGIAGNPAVARQLWNLNNTPVARAPFSPVNGNTPVNDIQGGIGDLMYGGFNQAQLVHGTYRGLLNLTP